MIARFDRCAETVLTALAAANRVGVLSWNGLKTVLSAMLSVRIRRLASSSRKDTGLHFVEAPPTSLQVCPGSSRSSADTLQTALHCNWIDG